jgi:calcium-binding protein CML
VLVSLGIKQGREQKDCRRMIGRVDRHGDGCVDFGDFKEMMRATGLPRWAQAELRAYIFSL